MRTGRSAAATTMFGLAVALGSVAPSTPAIAALDPAVLEAVQSDEVALVAMDIAALLEGADPDAEEQEIAASLHRYLADTVYAPGVIKDALAVVILGEWTEVQYAALKSIFSNYAVPDVKPPSGGGEAATMTSGGAAKTAAVEDEGVTLETAAVAAPAGGASQSLSTAGPATPPPTEIGGTGSDYQP